MKNNLSQNEIIRSIRSLDKSSIKHLLLVREDEQEQLFAIAREIRQNSIFKDKVELRSVIEMSNICAQKCSYCSIAKDVNSLFTLSYKEILDTILKLAKRGRKTFLLQSGENKSDTFIKSVSQAIKDALIEFSDLNFILCMGNLSDIQYEKLRNSGAKRYILKFETSNPYHHKFCRPTDTIENRLNRINKLIDIGFQVGSGNICGLPNQTLDNLFDDLVLIDKLKLTMVSSTRFISSENSLFSKYPDGDINLTLNFLAILRILKPDCLIPSTTSLAINKDEGQLKGLMAGCNTITVHDGTPKKLEENYSIYSIERFNPAEDFCVKIINKAEMVASGGLI